MGSLDHGEGESLIVYGSETGDFSDIDLLGVFAGQGQREGGKV